MASALFRFNAGVGRKMILANTFGTGALVTLIVLGGFIISRSRRLFQLLKRYMNAVYLIIWPVQESSKQGVLPGKPVPDQGVSIRLQAGRVMHQRENGKAGQQGDHLMREADVGSQGSSADRLQSVADAILYGCEREGGCFYSLFG